VSLKNLLFNFPAEAFRFVITVGMRFGLTWSQWRVYWLNFYVR